MTGESIRQQLARASARAQSLPSRARPTWTRPFREPKPDHPGHPGETAHNCRCCAADRKASESA